MSGEDVVVELGTAPHPHHRHSHNHSHQGMTSSSAPSAPSASSVPSPLNQAQALLRTLRGISTANERDEGEEQVDDHNRNGDQNEAARGDENDHSHDGNGDYNNGGDDGDDDGRTGAAAAGTEGNSIPNRRATQENQEDTLAGLLVSLFASEGRIILKILIRLLPMMVLLFFVFVFHHVLGILYAVWCIGLGVKANLVFKEQVSLKQDANWVTLTHLFFGLLTHIIATLYLFSSSGLIPSLLFFPPTSNDKEPLDIWGYMWIIFCNDYLVCFAGIMVKCIVIMCLSTRASSKRIGQYLSVVEMTTRLYRIFLPLPLWCHYFDTLDFGGIFSFLMSSLYLGIKGSECFTTIHMWLVSVRTLFGSVKHFGKVATPEEIMEAGNQCPICHDPPTEPIRLECDHIFCEDCITCWFERKKTCPVCRASIKGLTGQRFCRDGSTMVFPMAY